MASSKKIKKAKAKNTQATKQALTKTEPVSVQKSIKATPQSKGYSSPILPGNWKMNTGIFLLLVIITLILYSGDLHLGFFSIDDTGYVTDDPWIKKISVQNIGHILTTPYFSNYSPVHLFSYMLDYAIAGSNAFVFHLSSNIWAGLVSGFVFLVALAFTRRHIIAIAAATLFIVHPAHVEAVAWISSRKDLVATAFALPSLLAYLKYRSTESKKWYIISLLLYLFAVAGKVSVAIFPAVFFFMDIFIEKRSFIKSLIDKIPFIFLTAIIALVVYSAQPLSGNPPDPYVFSAAFSQSLWLLSGFGKYVIYRLRPETAGMGIEILSTLFLIALFIAPILLRRRFPIIVVLIYWILLGWLPAQLLSFVHPVSDRYLFFPSVALVILIAWAIISAGEKLLKRKGMYVSIVLLLIVAILWALATLNYLSEWRDSRSVWYSAMDKSTDPDVPYSLGGYYLTVAGRLGTTPRGGAFTKEETTRIASAIWAQNPKLQNLLSEWEKGQHGGETEKEFQNYLWTLTSENFEKALKTKGNHVFPHLYFRQGVLLLDKGDLKGARKEFMTALNETSLSTVEDIRKEITVSSHNALGAISWKEGNYREALQWYKMAEEEQARFGGNWIPDISSKRQSMEDAVAMLPGGSGTTNKTTDPEIAYSIGVRYLEAADQLSNTPTQKYSKEKSEQLANDVWGNNKQLPELLSEWNKNQHGGPAETNFQQYLRKLAWDAFEQSLHSKGSRIMPNLYFRRGMALGESGDLKGAKKEFLAALNEASHDSDINIKQEVTVHSHDALGIIEWKAGNYNEALSWFKIVEEEQNRFGKQWIPDILSKKQQMETMINKKR